MSKRRRRMLIASAIAPSVVIFGLVRLLQIEAVWLFAYFAFIFTLISFLLASTFVEWTEQPDYSKRRFFERPRLRR